MTFDPLENALYQFFSQEKRQAKPFILALSGGPDSMALFHLISALSKRLSLQWAVAHIDHSWREESRKEATLLKALCEEKKVPFYLKTLEGCAKSNKEEVARRKRLDFFKELKERLGFDSVVLGHHKGDLAENVLKRLFEGASFENVGNLSEETFLEGLELWRPLLGFEKKEMTLWLKQKGHFWFEDRTNSDPEFLRTRLKSSIIPELEKAFGKGICENLIERAQESRRLKAFLERRIAALWKANIEKGLLDRGVLDLSLMDSKELKQEAKGPLELLEKPLDLFEVEYLVKKFFGHVGRKISRQEKLMLTELLRSPRQNRMVQVGKDQVHVFRKTLRFIDKDLKKGVKKEGNREGQKRLAPPFNHALL